MFGPGIYFADNAYYSHRHYPHKLKPKPGPTDITGETKQPEDVRQLLLGYVLCGENKHYGDKYAKVRPPTEKAPFVKESGLVHQFYDSVSCLLKVCMQLTHPIVYIYVFHLVIVKISCCLRCESCCDGYIQVSMGGSIRGSMVVVYDNCQCYPAYVVTYKTVAI